MAQNPYSDIPYDYEDLEARKIAKKLPDFKRGREERNTLFHVIYAEQFDRKTLDRLCRLATRLRLISKTEEGGPYLANLLRQKSAMLYFTQPSTRTYLSFVRACQYLGMDYAEVRDPRISSALKGESDLDALRTFSSYFDVVILRHHQAGFAERAAYMMKFDCDRPIPVISGGAGSDQHPTQALLDVYTLKRSFEERRIGGGPRPGPMKDRTVAFVGDIKRGRTVHSLSKLLAMYDGMRLVFVSPPELAMDDTMREWLDHRGVEYQESGALEPILPEVDAVYMTRIQDEHDREGDTPVDYSAYHLTREMVVRMKDTAIVMHPLPRRDELDIRIDQDPRAMYWRQERNGMWIRSALLAYLLEVEAEINDYYLTQIEEQHS